MTYKPRTNVQATVATTYESKPCKRCGGTTRYLKGRECIICKKAKHKAAWAATYVPKGRINAQAVSIDGVTYYGRPCLEGHSGLRYLSSHACAECTEVNKREDKAKARNAMLMTLYPDEFDARGFWHHD